jgi:hypothetical protein
MPGGERREQAAQQQSATQQPDPYQTLHRSPLPWHPRSCARPWALPRWFHRMRLSSRPIFVSSVDRNRQLHSGARAIGSVLEMVSVSVTPGSIAFPHCEVPPNVGPPAVRTAKADCTRIRSAPRTTLLPGGVSSTARQYQPAARSPTAPEPPIGADPPPMGAGDQQAGLGTRRRGRWEDGPGLGGAPEPGRRRRYNHTGGGGGAGGLTVMPTVVARSVRHRCSTALVIARNAERVRARVVIGRRRSAH